VALPPATVSKASSLITQRLIENYSDSMQNNAATPNSTIASTGSTQDYSRDVPQMQLPTHMNYLPTSSQCDYQEKERPKRRRKPQKPGKTAKQNERHFVVHDYHDHSCDTDEDDDSEQQEALQRRRGGVTISFPLKLHAVLDQVERDGLAHVISWQEHGRCFVIHKPKEFVEHVMPSYFRQSKLTSFQRQLNLYGFARLTRGKDSGGYYHELFLRSKLHLCKRMSRTKIKGTKFKAASSPQNEPDFYSIAPVAVSPSNSIDGSTAWDGVQASRSMVRRKTEEPCFPDNSCAPWMNMEPVPVYASSQRAMTSMEPYPLLAPIPTMSSRKNMAADSILDEAVDELFSRDPMMEDTQDLDSIWDSAAFGQDAVRDDTQLGYLLEMLLQD